MDILILAGGDAPLDLAQAAGESERALIAVDGAAMVRRVIIAMRGLREVERIAVVGSTRVLDECREIVPNMVRVEAANKMTQNFARGTKALEGGKEILICTCDIPLVTAQTFTSFLEKARVRNLEIAYPIVTRNACETAFPDGARTYSKLGGVEVTGGNCALIPTRIAPNVTDLLETAYNARKNPLALSKMLGPSLVWKFIAKKLTVEDVEQHASRVLDCRVGAVECDDATIAFDVDKLSHWQSAEKYLQARNL